MGRMARNSEPGPPSEPPLEGSSGLSRLEIEDLVGPTTQMAPLFGEGTSDAPLVIEEYVPIPSGEHPVLLSRDSLPEMEVVDLRMSGMVPIDDLGTEPFISPPVISQGPASPAATDRRSSDATEKLRIASTSLGVAPLEPATLVRAPFVVETPVQRWSPLRPAPMAPVSMAPAPMAPAPMTPAPMTPAPITPPEENRHERTAMSALDPSSGMPRRGPWQALVTVAKSLGTVRWWAQRRRTSRVKPLER